MRGFENTYFPPEFRSIKKASEVIESLNPGEHDNTLLEQQHWGRGQSDKKKMGSRELQPVLSPVAGFYATDAWPGQP